MASQAVTLGVIERLKVTALTDTIHTAVSTCEMLLLHVNAPMSVFVPSYVCLCGGLVLDLLSALYSISVTCPCAFRPTT